MFRQETKFSQRKFFLRYGTGKPVLNIIKELDCLQRDYSIKFMTSSEARHVLETLKWTVGLDFTSTTVYVCIRELHRDGDDGTTVVMGLNFITDTAVIAWMGTAFTVVPRER